MTFSFSRFLPRPRTLGLLSAALLAMTLAAPVQAQDDPLPTLRILESGHSLTDGVMVPLQDMINAGGGRAGTLIKSTLPGSPMEIRWKDPTDPDQREPEVMAQFDVFVNTERVALSGTLPWHDSPGYALKFMEHAWEHGNDGKGATSILYSSWVSLDSGPDYENPYKDPDGLIPFRERLDREMVLWEQILNHANENRPEGAPEMKMIPGTLVMAAAYDDIAAGNAPGIDDFRQMFSDDIHTNEMGGYLIALAHYAVIFNRDPRGLPAGVPARGGPSPEQAAWMQELVWNVVSNYPAAHVDGSGQIDYPTQ